MFKISEAILISIHALYILANSKTNLMPSSEVANILGKSKNHVKIILNRLTKVGLIESVRGPNGGFKIIDATLNLTLLEIHEIIDGPITTNTEQCFLEKRICGGQCLFGSFIHSTNSQLKEYLNSKILSDFIEDKDSSD